MKLSKKAEADLRRHQDHLTVIGGGNRKQVRFVLDTAKPGLVRALRALTRVVESQNAMPEEMRRKHPKKIAKMVSPRVAHRNAEKVVKGQRGGFLFSTIARVGVPLIAGLFKKKKRAEPPPPPPEATVLTV